MRFASLLLLLSASPVFAQSAGVTLVETDAKSYGGAPAGEGLAAPRFSVTVAADEIVIPLTLQVVEETEAKAAAGLDELRELVAKSLGSKARLVPVAPASYVTTFGGKVRSAGSSIFGGGDSQSSTTRASASFRITSALGPKQSPQVLFLEIKPLLAEVKFASSGRIERGGWALGLSNPEAHRGQLMQQVAKAVESDLAALGGKTKVAVEGLEKPLSHAVVSDRDIRLSLPVTISYDVQR